MELFTGRAQVHKKLSDSVNGNVSHAAARPQAISLYQHPKNGGSVGN
jgi:hypothetical protein